MATSQPFGPQTGFSLPPAKMQAVPGAFDSYAAPFNNTQKKGYLTSHGYNPEEADALMSGGNPVAKDTITYAPKKPPVSASVGMAKKGVALSPDNLQKLRSQGIPDDVIADEMAKSSTHFALQLKKIRTKFVGDPAATSAFLGTRFYGDPQYNPTKQTEQKNYLTKTLDHVYQSANDVLGEGGVMEQYNRGEIGPLQAVGRSAGAIYHGALTPVLDPLTDITKGVLDATGASSALQSGFQAARESQLGQAVEPYVQNAVEGYQNLPQNSGWRDLAAAGQAGLDTLGVLGAESAVQTSKRAGTQAATHPWQTIRHPIQSGKAVWTGKGPTSAGPGGTTGATTERQLTGTAKEAVSKGMDEKFMTFAAEQNPDTRAVMAKMTEAAHEGGNVLGGTVKHKEILGGQMMDSAAYVLEKKQAIGKALGAMKSSVADELINLSDDYDDILTQLRNKGAVINEKGKIISLAGAADDNIPLLQKTLDFLQPDDVGNVVRSGKEVDMWRTKMFEEMNSAKAKLQPSSAGQSTLGFAEKLTNDVRRSTLVRMAKGNSNLVAANDAYEELATASSQYLKSIGYKGKLNVEAITAKELRAGEVALRTLGNASAETRDAFTKLIETAKKYGRVSSVDDMALIKYADALEDVFPITPTRSLSGQVSRGTKDALGNFTEDVITQGPKASITRAIADRLIDRVNSMRGITPENRYRLLMEVLNAPPETEFFTIMEKVLPDSEVPAQMKGVTAGELAPSARAELSQATPSSQEAPQLPRGGASQPPTQGGLQTSPKMMPQANANVNENRLLGLHGEGADDSLAALSGGGEPNLAHMSLKDYEAMHAAEVADIAKGMDPKAALAAERAKFLKNQK